jgi:hypothetical protein
MPFLLDSDSLPSEMADSINYLLANFGANISADPNSGEISGPSGIIIAYLYRYLAVKYADSADGSVNFSNSPTNRQYYGLRNTNDTTESTNPADYIWNKVAGAGFGTTKFLFYQTNGGRQINFVVDTVAPDSTYLQESGLAIDLDVVTTTTAYNTAAPSIYIWTSTSTPPTRPSTTSTYIWASGTYIPPVGWTSTPITNTTPGSYLWAITIPLVVNANTETSTLNWASTSFPLYAFSYNGENGEPGATGATGISAITAFRVQSQSDAAPPTPGNTTGPTAPSGWSLTAPAVSVGQVLWYSFGRYNSSGSTLSGIPAGQTAWGTPTAASIFQDIRSDNWNGSNPPTFGVPSSYGTTGYYIQRTTGDVFFNNGIYRGDISTDGDAYFAGDNVTTTTFPVGTSSFLIDYSCYGNGATSASSSSIIRAGVLGESSASVSSVNVGVFGYAPDTGKGYGVVGVGGFGGGFFQGTGNSSSAISLRAFNTTTNAIDIIIGKFKYQTVTIEPPPGSSTSYLRGNGAWGQIPFNDLDLIGVDLVAKLIGTSGQTSGLTGVTFSGTLTGGAAGTITWTMGSSTAAININVTSDSRLKKDIQDIEHGIDFIKKLKPVQFKWNHELFTHYGEKQAFGFLAGDVEELVGEDTTMVTTIEQGPLEGYKSFSNDGIVAALVKSVQQLSAKVDEQQKLIELLQNKG